MFVIENNNSYWYTNGCGFGIKNSSATIRNNVIRNNNGGYLGCGIYVYQSNNLVIENNIIYGHIAESGNGVAYGAGICINSSNFITIKKNLIYDNLIDFGNGDGIAIRSSSGYIHGNTIFNNSNSEWGINVYIDEGSIIEIKNSILWSDIANFGHEVYSYGAVNVRYCVIRNGYEGTGNTDRNPLFEDMINRDFRLTLQSPCINSGDADCENDPDGSTADIGYYYYDLNDYGSLYGSVTLAPGLGSIDNVLLSIDSYEIVPYDDGSFVF